MNARPLPKLHLVTNRKACGDRSLVETVSLAVRAGVQLVQLREKDLCAADLLDLAVEVKKVTEPAGARLVVNDRVDVALAVDADGVQLGAASLPVAEARRLLGKGRWIGTSVHSLEEAVQAERAGADFLVLGTIFATSSKPGRPPDGPELVREITRVVGLPVIAIGGIDEENLPLVLENGAYGVAVISAILKAPDPGAATRRLMARLPKHS